MPEVKTQSTPPWLVKWFASGLVLALLGLLTWPFSSLAGSALLAVGSVSVVLSLLRGQDMQNARR